jgi:hypothetical protein
MGDEVIIHTMMRARFSSWKQYLCQFFAAIGQIIYGASVYEMVRDLRKERSHLEHLFILIVFGDILGIPVLPPYYSLRLLPYAMPNFMGWKRRMSRERDLTDLCDQG